MAPKLKMFSKLKDNTTNNNHTNRRKSTSTHSTSDPSTSTSTNDSSNPKTFPLTYTHNHEPTTLVETLAEGSSIKLIETTRYALSKITAEFLIETYISPLIRYFHNLYISQPPGSVERLGMWGCLVAGTLPVGCLVIGVGMAGVGCFIVTGSALLIIQMSCLAFMSCVLAPAGVLTTLFVGLPSLFLYGSYSFCSFLLSHA